MYFFQTFCEMPLSILKSVLDTYVSPVELFAYFVLTMFKGGTGSLPVKLCGVHIWYGSDGTLSLNEQLECGKLLRVEPSSFFSFFLEIDGWKTICHGCSDGGRITYCLSAPCSGPKMSEMELHGKERNKSFFKGELTHMESLLKCSSYMHFDLFS